MLLGIILFFLKVSRKVGVDTKNVFSSSILSGYSILLRLIMWLLHKGNINPNVSPKRCEKSVEQDIKRFIGLILNVSLMS